MKRPIIEADPHQRGGGGQNKMLDKLCTKRESQGQKGPAKGKDDGVPSSLRTAKISRIDCFCHRPFSLARLLTRPLTHPLTQVITELQKIGNRAGLSVVASLPELSFGAYTSSLIILGGAFEFIQESIHL